MDMYTIYQRIFFIASHWIFYLILWILLVLPFFVIRGLPENPQHTTVMLLSATLLVGFLFFFRKRRWVKLVSLVFMGVFMVNVIRGWVFHNEIVMDGINSEVCQGLPLRIPSIRMSEKDASKAWFHGSEFKIPDRFKAEYPDQFRYAVCLIESRNLIGKPCEYGSSQFGLGSSRFGLVGGHTISRFQIVWIVELRDTLTGKPIKERRTFEGALPGECPREITISYRKGDKPPEGGNESIIGNQPNKIEVENWLTDILSR